MTRRETLALVATAALAQAPAPAQLDKPFGGAQGVAVVIDVATGRCLAAHRMETARQLVAAPGSAIKPFALLCLMNAAKLQADEGVPCTGRLQINGASFACTHPKVQVPITTATAIAYSCNEFVSHMARRFAPGELAGALAKFGFTRATRAAADTSSQLQALGERHITATALEMAEAYRRMATRLAHAPNSPILQGLEQAVEYGTAQKAAATSFHVAGKTGTAPGGWAWFAGFASSRSPRIATVVLVQGRAGGADAAPIAGRIFNAHAEGRF